MSFGPLATTRRLENTFGISFAETPDQTGVLEEFPNFWEKISVIDFQSIARKTLLSFLASYLTPKTGDLDEKKLKQADMNQPHENVNPGLEPCALALGSLENNPRRLA